MMSKAFTWKYGVTKISFPCLFSAFEKGRFANFADSALFLFNSTSRIHSECRTVSVTKHFNDKAQFNAANSSDDFKFLIFDCDVTRQPRPLPVARDFVSELSRLNSISSRFNLRGSNFRLVSGHLLSGSEGEKNENNRPATHDKSNYRSPAHHFGEKGHLLLSIKVAGGFYLLMNTVPHGYRIKRQTFIVNTILGILYMCLRALFGSYYLFGLLGG